MVFLYRNRSAIEIIWNLARRLPQKAIVCRALDAIRCHFIFQPIPVNRNHIPISHSIKGLAFLPPFLHFCLRQFIIVVVLCLKCCVSVTSYVSLWSMRIIGGFRRTMPMQINGCVAVMTGNRVMTGRACDLRPE